MRRVKLELLLLVRNPTLLILSALIVLSAIFAVHQGQLRLTNEHSDYSALVDYAVNDFSHWQSKSTQEDFDFGSMGYYYFEPTQHPAQPLAALFSGQRVMDMLSHNIRLLAITGQIYGQERHNPDLQLHGYLDLGFIFIFIMPLLVGVMTSRLWSSENESGRLLLLRAVIPSAQSLINFRFLFIYILIALFQLLLLVYGFLAIGLSINTMFVKIYGALLLYQTVWFILSWCINRFQIQSIKAGLAYISIWILLTLVIPGVAINYSQYRYPVTQGIDMMLDQRQYMHNAWDRNKQSDLEEFYQLFPQYSHSAPMSDQFHWKWYFAMQFMSDYKVEGVKKAYWQQIHNRIEMNRKFSYLSPAIALQNHLTRYAKTDIYSQMAYWRAVEHYHNSLFSYFAQHLFYDKKPAAGLPDYPRFEYPDSE